MVGLLFWYAIFVVTTTVKAVDTTKPSIKILQLGDSFSAGNGARDKKGDRNYYGPKDCFRSPTNWGAQYAEALRTNYNVTYSNHACGLSYLKNLMNPKLVKTEVGQCPDNSTWLPDEYFVQNSTNCTHYVVPQIDFVDNTTNLVIMTMGGNDALMIDLVHNCVVNLGIKNAATLCKATADQSIAKMPTIQQEMRENFLQIWNKMGNRGKVVIFQYPYLVQDKRRMLRDVGYRIDAARAFRNVMQIGNNAIADACDQANSDAGVDFCVTFNKTPALFACHETNPFYLRLNPIAWEWSFLTTRWTSEMFHPNPKGHKNWGAAAAAEGIFNLVL